MEDQHEIKLPFYVRLAAILLSLVLITFLLSKGSRIIIPLFFSLLISLMLLPLTRWMERYKIHRALAAIISVLIFIVFIGSVFFFLGTQIVEFSKDLPLLGSRMQAWIPDLQGWIATRFNVDASRQLEYVNKSAADFARIASAMAQSLLLAVTEFAIWTIFVFIFTYFMLTHRALLQNFVTCLFARKDQPRVTEVITEIRLLANSYVLGLLIEMIVVAILNCTLFFIFGVRYALLLGVLAAVMNIIPYIGIYSAAAIASLITLSNSAPGLCLCFSAHQNSPGL